MATQYQGDIAQALNQYAGIANPKQGTLDHWNKVSSEQGREAALEGIKGSNTAKMFQERQAKSSVAGQMDNITSQDSPLMQRAATKGKQYANNRGLLNSSLGAQASQAAMIDAAMPIAQQDAGYQQDLGRMGEQNKFTQEQMRLGHQQDIERLGASSAANAWGVMANNATDIVSKTMEGIANINANPDISQADKTKMIKQMTKMRDTDIKFQQDLYRNLSGFLKNTGLFPNL